MTAAPEPDVSVVIPSVSGSDAILECLAALADQDGAIPAEVLVVDRTGELTRDAIRRHFPGVRVVAMDMRSPLPEMRGRGVAEARGRMIAVLGEHLRPARSWLRAIGDAQREGRDATFGPIDSGGLAGAAEWAFFLSEYGRFMPPVAALPHEAVPGSNCVYRRSALDQVGARSGAALWDGDLAARLGRAGVKIGCEPGLVAQSEKRTGARRLLAQRHHCSRTWAAHRSAAWPRRKRLGFALATPLLPPLLLVRIARVVLSKRRHRRELLRAFPLLVALSIVWASGEAVGVLFGPGPSPGLLE